MVVDLRMHLLVWLWWWLEQWHLDLHLEKTDVVIDVLKSVQYLSSQIIQSGNIYCIYFTNKKKVMFCKKSWQSTSIFVITQTKCDSRRRHFTDDLTKVDCLRISIGSK